MSTTTAALRFDRPESASLPVPCEGRIALRIGEAAAAIGVCRATFWRLMHAGDIPVVRIGGCRRILRRDSNATWRRTRRGQSRGSGNP